MENILASENYLDTENIYETILNIETKYDKSGFNEFSYGLSAEHGKNLFRYLKNFKLSKDPELLILPPNNHYYFDEKELRNVRTLINLKNLNLVKDLNSFLYTLVTLLPNEANFIGYFEYSKMSFAIDNLFSNLSSRLYNLLDSKTDHNLDKKELTARLLRYGFRVIDMTEINGLTFFYAQTVAKAQNFSA